MLHVSTLLFVSLFYFLTLASISSISLAKELEAQNIVHLVYDRFTNS